MNAICVVRGFYSKEVTSLLVCGNITTSVSKHLQLLAKLLQDHSFSLFFVGMLLNKAGRIIVHYQL